MSREENFHFFASNAGAWYTTAIDRDLRSLLKLMEADGLPYMLCYVPLPWNSAYEVKSYQPVVDGIIFMGMFFPKSKGKREYK